MPQTSTFIVPMLGLHLFSNAFSFFAPPWGPLGGAHKGAGLLKLFVG